VKHYFGLGSIIGGGAIALMVSQPGWSQETQVTGVRLSQSDGGIQVILDTQNGDRPNIFTVSQGNTLIADATNTKLSLPNGNGFLQNNPAPGISSIMVTQLDANSVRVVVNGETGAPVGQVTQSPNNITLSFAAGANGQIAQAAAPASQPGALQAAPLPQTTAQASPTPGSDLPVPDVLVPNPTVTINGAPPSPSQIYVPSTQSRAVPPPLGDIAIANIDTTGDTIDLGSSEVVPRLVLRDAPVRDVLSLLGRAAGINVAYIDQGASAPGSTPDQAGAAAAGAPGATGAQTRVSLDIENESVQDVFNYVLRISGLEANRQNRTVFVSPRLPDEARDVVARSLRLNQVGVNDAANVLTAQGAETQVPFTRVEIQTLGEGAAARTVEVRTPEILGLRANRGNGPLLLSGLSVTTDSRLNTVTLIGTPRKVQIASSILAQLDLRQRQVAVNVRIVDVNLIATEDFGTSFSFGIGDGFFSNDNGSGNFSLGPARPPSRADVTGSRLNPPITAAPLPPGVTAPDPFLDTQPDASLGTGSPQSFSTNPSLNDGTVQLDGGQYARPPFGTENNPLLPGATDITVSPGQPTQITYSLPTLFQYPTRFLASLRAQIVSGNAKILTDPTIVVQEGERARVQLTQQVPTNVTTQTNSTGGSTITNTTLVLSDAGVILDVLVDRIDDNGFVTLSVSPEVSAPQETRNFQNTQVTFLAQRRLTTGRIRVRDGQTLILSGIIQERDQSTVTKIPILGDIPLLGALFRSTSRENTRNEVIVLLTPQILDDSDQSTYGYGYTPGAEVQQMLRQR
jgi:type IV pilus assembly protein PilQ